MWVSFLLRFSREKKGLLPSVGFLYASFACFYLGPFVTFLSLIITGSNIDVTLYAWLSYFITPFAITNAMWLGFTLFNPNRKKIAFIIFILSGIPYYIFLFGFPTQMVVLNASSIADLNAAGKMIDISITSVLFVFNAFYILSMVFILTGGFYYLQQKITGIERKKIRYLAFGWLILGLGFIIENALGSLGDLAKISARVLVVIAISMIYLGFSGQKTAKSDKQEIIHAEKPEVE